MSRALINLIRFYRLLFRPFVGSGCRFTPTCSEYGLSAIEKYGAFHGSWLIVRRIFRCHPFCSGGFDPLP